MIQMQKLERASEIATVSELAHEIWTRHYVPIIGREQVEYMLDRFQSSPAIARQIADGYAYFLVKEKDLPIGYFSVRPDPPGHSALLSKLYVKPEHQGTGIGRAMVEFVESFCRKSAIGTLWLTVNRNNRGAIAFYKRVGFHISEILVQDIGGGFVMDDYKMEKPI